jgi:aerobic carbon-monoxide dehydrogenase medium subunit
MYPPRFDYERPTTLDEALELLVRHGNDAKLIAGGQTMIPLLKLRLASPAVLVDVNRLTELEHIADCGNAGIRIGALVRHSAMEVAKWPRGLAILRDAATVIADPQVRNLGTVGGSLATVDPAGDWPTVMLALDATLHVVSRNGHRELDAEGFYRDAYTNALAADEMLKEVLVPVPPAEAGTAYLKMKRKSGDFAIASAAVCVAMDERGKVARVRIGLGGVGLVPLRAHKAEAVLQSCIPDDSVLAAAADAVRSQCEPVPDVRGSVDYKRHVAGVLFTRAMRHALRRARGEIVEIERV